MGLQVQFYHLYLLYHYYHCPASLWLIVEEFFLLSRVVLWYFFPTYPLLIFVIWLWLFKNRDVSFFITRNSVVHSLKWGNREYLQGGNRLRSSLESMLSGLSSPTISLSILLRTQFTCLSHGYPYIAQVHYPQISSLRRVFCKN